MSNLSTSLVMLLIIAFLGMASLDVDVVAYGKYYLAQAGSYVGVTASVPPNPYNTVAKQLDDKSRELALREKQLEEREKNTAEASKDPLVYYAIGISLGLVCINFVLDFRRRKLS